MLEDMIGRFIFNNQGKKNDAALRGAFRQSCRALRGDINVHSAAQIVAQGQNCIRQAQGEWCVDLQAVEQASSAAVALLLGGCSARAQNKAFYIENLPAQLRPILGISDLEPFFAPRFARGNKSVMMSPLFWRW